MQGEIPKGRPIKITDNIVTENLKYFFIKSFLRKNYQFFTDDSRKILFCRLGICRSEARRKRIWSSKND